MARLEALTLLAPDIVEAILDGRQPAEIQLDVLLRPFPVEWDDQAEKLSQLSERSNQADEDLIRKSADNVAYPR